MAYYHTFRDGVDFVFVDHPSFHNRGNDLYGGSRLDVTFRCALLCKAALETPWHVPCGGVVYGDASLVFIANDWHSALLPVYLKVRQTLSLSNQQRAICSGTLSRTRETALCQIALCPSQHRFSGTRAII